MGIWPQPSIHVQAYYDSCVAVHPHWEIMFWDMAMAEALVREHYAWFLPYWDSYDMEVPLLALVLCPTPLLRKCTALSLLVCNTLKLLCKVFSLIKIVLDALLDGREDCYMGDLNAGRSQVAI